MNANETIAAISTAPGIGAIAIIRVSGPQAINIVAGIFRTGGRTDGIWKPKSHRAYFGHIYSPESQESLDQVVLITYLAPKTYTGEDLVEINCHGSPLVTREIMALLLSRGCRLAQKGEFTKRAFLTGRIDLTQAEAVLDLIHSKTERQAKLALTALKGQLGREINLVRKELLELMTRLIAGIDFPEEVGELDLSDINVITKRNLARLFELEKTARSGRYLRQGLKLAIVGRPNAGKSSLLNKILNFERAIVTDIPGTTRDSIEEPVDINGIPVILVDTAGIRHTEDTVEKIGINRSRKAIEEADLVMFLLDKGENLEDEREIAGALATLATPTLLVRSKCDLEEALPLSGTQAQLALLAPINKVSEEIYHISSLTGTGLETLKSGIESWALAGSHLQELGGSLNERQGQLCRTAIGSLQNLQTALTADLPQDCLATDLRECLDSLDEINGDVVTEEIITEVFANFCIGK
jgi:tRNA modification GTPase